MIKKSDVLITHKHYSLENGIFTLQIDVGDYDLTNKTITAKFNPKEVETGNLDVIDGIINLPIYSNLLKYGSNYIQLNFRWDIDKLEQSPKMIWIIDKSLETEGVAEEDIDIISYLINEIKSAKETADRVISDVGDIKQSLDASVEQAGESKTALDGSVTLAGTMKDELDGSITSATNINNTLADPVDGTMKRANDSRVALEGKITDAGTAKSEIEQAIVDNQIVTQSEFTQHKLDYAEDIGTVANLTTTSKEVVGAVNELDALKADLSEIESARGTEPTLGARLDSTDAQLNDIEQNFTQHKLDYMPHRFENKVQNKTYKFGFQVSDGGSPQIIFEEVI